MKFSMIKVIIVFLLFVQPVFSAPPASTDEKTESEGQPFSIRVKTNPGTREEQIKLARDLTALMVQADENQLDALEQLHLQVIESAPDVQHAQNSIWMLSNMYEFAYSTPQAEKQMILLEHLFGKYPDSTAAPLLANRLLNAYRSLGKPEKLVEFYGKVFQSKEIDDRTFVLYGLDYAKALKEIGKRDEAKAMFEAVIQKDGKSNSFEGNLAKTMLADLK